MQRQNKRYTLHPIRHHDLKDRYNILKETFWVPEDVEMSEDFDDFKTYTEGEQEFIKKVLAFFAASDAIVNENLAINLLANVPEPEAGLFYALQIANEGVHSESYSLMIESLVESEEEKEFLFNAIETFPFVKKKAEWAFKYIDEDANKPKRLEILSKIGTGELTPEQADELIQNLPEDINFAKQQVAFAAVEGIFFSASFASIFWIKSVKKNMPGLCKYNEWISRDEGVHLEFAVNYYKNHLSNKLDPEEVKKILLEACELEKEFARDSLQLHLLGINQDLMCQYIQYVTDTILVDFGVGKHYGSLNPFPFMEQISLSGEKKSNFFERRPTYNKGIASGELNFDEDNF